MPFSEESRINVTVGGRPHPRPLSEERGDGVGRGKILVYTYIIYVYLGEEKTMCCGETPHNKWHRRNTPAPTGTGNEE